MSLFFFFLEMNQQRYIHSLVYLTFFMVDLTAGGSGQFPSFEVGSCFWPTYPTYPAVHYSVDVRKCLFE